MNIGRVTLGSFPRIVVILHDQAPVRSLKTLKGNGADIVEARIDLFHSAEIESILNSLKRIKQTSRLPIIATIRRSEDGGKRSVPDHTRLEFFKVIIPLVDCIDTEIDSPITDEVIRLAKRRKKKVIVSYHNFKETPSDQHLVKLIRKGKIKGGDIVKLAVTGRNVDDVARLLTLTHKHRDTHLITISMGKKGQISRVVAPLFGSLLTYGYVDSPIAPGQLSIGELKRMMGSFFSRAGESPSILFSRNGC
jgi:3-dehydroquinate dehydratase-1